MEWQSIESAPRDGTYILGYLAGGYGPNQSVIHWTGETWAVVPTRDYRLSFLATHWQPLPAEPTV